MNLLFAIVLLFAFPGTSATIRGGQVDAETSSLYEKAQRQLKAGDGGGMGGMGGGVMGMKVS